MTSRYDNNDGRYYGDERSRQRQDNGAYGQGSARQRFSRNYDTYEDQETLQANDRGRLRYDDAMRDSGQAARTRQRQAADYDRARYTSRNDSGMQGMRTQDQMRQQDRARRQATIQGAQQGAARSGGRRQVHLDQTSQVPRYGNPQQTGSWSQQSVQRQTSHGRSQQYGNMAERYNRGNVMYQARPDAASNVVNAASGAQGGFLSSPISFIVRIVLIVVLVGVFGVRAVLNSGSASQLAEANSSIESQQEQLDSLTSQNEELQSNIDSRQDTLDAYNKLVQASN